MERTRREALRLAGLSVATAAAGCLGGTGRSSTDGLPEEMERVDEPPQTIEAGKCSPPDSERDPLYLCENIPAEPSLSFTQATTRGTVLREGGLELSENTDDQLYATLLTEQADRDRVVDEPGDPAQLVRDTDFESHAALVVQTGWGSGSVYPHLKRVEETADGIHAVGCHTDPCIQTDDLTSRTTAVRFERPEELTSAVVSLTVSPEQRWNVAVGEGVVEIPSAE